MIRAPYDANRMYDVCFERVIKTISKAIDSKDDDFLLMTIGTAGSGKTHLMLHGYDLYADNPSIEQIALTRPDMAIAMKNAKDAARKRFVGYDEANVTKREAMSDWNKKLIDLYFSIRGLRIFHWWNNPSLDYIDKVFIEERVKGVIFIWNKGKHYRKYWYFRKQDILKFLERNENLKLPTLKKHGATFAYYEGWFKAYNGALLPPYLEKKTSRMEDKVEEFHQQFAQVSGITLHEWCKKHGQAMTTAKRYYDRAKESLELKDGEDYFRKGMREYLTDKGTQKLLFCMQNPAYMRPVR